MRKMEEQLKVTLEKTQICDVLARYFAAVDDKQLDRKMVEETFTSNAKMIRPEEVKIIGHTSILESHKKSFDRFKATHHVITNYYIEITDSRATLRANLIANHVWKGKEDDPILEDKFFLADGVFHAKVQKINAIWLIYELSIRIVWRTGDGMEGMIKPYHIKD